MKQSLKKVCFVSGSCIVEVIPEVVKFRRSVLLSVFLVVKLSSQQHGFTLKRCS